MPETQTQQRGPDGVKFLPRNPRSPPVCLQDQTGLSGTGSRPICCLKRALGESRSASLSFSFKVILNSSLSLQVLIEHLRCARPALDAVASAVPALVGLKQALAEMQCFSAPRVPQQIGGLGSVTWWPGKAWQGGAWKLGSAGASVVAGQEKGSSSPEGGKEFGYLWRWQKVRAVGTQGEGG